MTRVFLNSVVFVTLNHANVVISGNCTSLDFFLFNYSLALNIGVVYTWWNIEASSIEDTVNLVCPLAITVVAFGGQRDHWVVTCRVLRVVAIARVVASAESTSLIFTVVFVVFPVVAFLFGSSFSTVSAAVCLVAVATTVASVDSNCVEVTAELAPGVTMSPARGTKYIWIAISCDTAPSGSFHWH